MITTIKNIVKNYNCACCIKSQPVPNKQKIALLFGLNYIGTTSALGGCINDVENMGKMLKDKYNYDKITILTDNTDDKPTKSNMLKFLNSFINESKNCEKAYFHYSGHGSYIIDKNNDELDGKDECLIPLDYNKTGFIIDDELKVIFNQIKCKLTVVIDACHSATVLDLKHRVDCISLNLTSKVKDTEDYLYQDWSYEFKLTQNAKYNENKNILMISGCRDNETSSDAFINNKYQGALTYHFCKALELNDYNVKIKYLLKDIHCMLLLGNFDQKPVLSSGTSINLDEKFIL